MIPDSALQLVDLAPALATFWQRSAEKIALLEHDGTTAPGAPVFTVHGRYTARGWTDWTQGFQVGSALLQFDATDAEPFLKLGRSATRLRMAAHVTHHGVHDHGFNIVSTYGALLRLLHEGRLVAESWEAAFYTLALQCSGAVQAQRWTQLPDGGFIHSFNGAHSLFADTIRSLRSLALAHALGHVLYGENDTPICLLTRLLQHARATARYAVYYGEGRDVYDLRGRVAHESIFNPRNGTYRCPNSQQGYSPFSTWTRGLAWVMLGFAEQLEFIAALDDAMLAPHGGKADIMAWMLRAAEATSDFYCATTAADGIPYWDTGAPGLAQLGDYRARPGARFHAAKPACGAIITCANWRCICSACCSASRITRSGTDSCHADHRLEPRGRPYLSGPAHNLQSGRRCRADRGGQLQHGSRHA
jgi:hypothetical protein